MTNTEKRARIAEINSTIGPLVALITCLKDLNELHIIDISMLCTVRITRKDGGHTFEPRIIKFDDNKGEGAIPETFTRLFNRLYHDAINKRQELLDEASRLALQ